MSRLSKFANVNCESGCTSQVPRPQLVGASESHPRTSTSGKSPSPSVAPAPSAAAAAAAASTLEWSETRNDFEMSVIDTEAAGAAAQDAATALSNSSQSSDRATLGQAAQAAQMTFLTKLQTSIDLLADERAKKDSAKSAENTLLSNNVENERDNALYILNENGFNRKYSNKVWSKI